MVFNPADSNDWFVKIGPNKAGPYTVQQIQTLLEDGEIQAFHKVTTAKLNGEWITAQELVLAYNEAAATAARKAKEEEERKQSGVTYSGSFQPPARPTDIGKAPGRPVRTEPGADPALSLFDTIQAVRERKTTAAKPQPPPSAPLIPPQPTSLFARLFPTQTSIIVALTLVLGLTAWGLLKMAEKNLKPVAKISPAPAGGAHPGGGPPPPGAQTAAPPPTHPKPLNLPKQPPAPPLQSLIKPKAPPPPPPPPPHSDPRRDEPPRHTEDDRRDFPQDNPPADSPPPDNGAQDRDRDRDRDWDRDRDQGQPQQPSNPSPPTSGEPL